MKSVCLDFASLRLPLRDLSGYAFLKSPWQILRVGRCSLQVTSPLWADHAGKARS